MRSGLFNIWFVLAAALLLGSCSGAMRPMFTEPAAPGAVSHSHEALRTLPEPQEKVVAAVYRFRDQTGQYKPSERIASWSTAVTQGATSILIKSMEDSGWFTPIERESISNLLNERQIIQNIRQQHAGEQQVAPLPPLLFAGIILEGGIIGYDTNIITGGAGARYLGIGASSQYRKDQVTIYVRAVSTQSGRILKTVHTTKSIISQQLESGVFKFVDTNRLLEAEAGYTYNEPPVMAVTEAIDEAVKMLILEGIEEEIWAARDPEAVSVYREQYAYEQRINEQMERDYFGLLTRPEFRGGWSLTTNATFGSIIGNYSSPEVNAGFSMQVERGLTPHFALQARGERTRIGATDVYSSPVNSAELALNMYITPEHRLSPFVSGGMGSFVFDRLFEGQDERFYPYVAAEAGLDYRFTRHLGVRLSSLYRYALVDGLDGVTLGKYNDQHWGINIGLIINPDY